MHEFAEYPVFQQDVVPEGFRFPCQHPRDPEDNSPGNEVDDKTGSHDNQKHDDVSQYLGIIAADADSFEPLLEHYKPLGSHKRIY
jgi:hypothetical protein